MTENRDVQGANRWTSLDALRGFDMFCLLVVDRIVRALAQALPDNGAVRFLREQFTHPSWQGFTFYDLIFPLFEFLIGISVWLSVSKRLARGNSRGSVLRHALARVTALVVLGMCVNGNLLTYDPSRFRLTYSVLQMLAIAYLIALLFTLFASLRGQILGFAALLAGYWALQTFVPLPADQRTYQNWMGQTITAPAHVAGLYVEGSLFSFWLDEQILGPTDRWKVGWILKSMTHGATALLGVLAARLLTSTFGNGWQKASRLALAGLVCLVLGWLWSWQFPIIKNIWSSSFVLWAGGWSLLLLAAFYAVTDVAGYKSWSYPLVVVGSNSIAAYMLATVFSPVLTSIAQIPLGGLALHSGTWQPLILALGSGLAGWFLLWLLYRSKTFIRL